MIHISCPACHRPVSVTAVTEETRCPGCNSLLLEALWQKEQVREFTERIERIERKAGKGKE